ncbi:MAG: TonB-dependent receptor [Duganella sp.]
MKGPPMSMYRITGSLLLIAAALPVPATATTTVTGAAAVARPATATTGTGAAPLATPATATTTDTDVAITGVGAAAVTASATAALASASADADAPQQVQVTAARADQRQRDTTTAIVVTHAELVRQGDQTLADALKRLPGISISGVPGQGGGISMRGLGNGYTRIMLDGDPVPAGFSLDAVAPEMIERVEILRSATAELSNQAVAGGINIILKKAAKRAQRSVTASSMRRGGTNSPTVAAQLSDQDGALSYSLAATLSRQRTEQPITDLESAEDATGAPVLLRRTPQARSTHIDALTLTPRLAWTLAGGDTLSWQGFVNLRHVDIQNRADERTLLGDASEFPRYVSDFNARFSTVRSDLQWMHRLDNGARLETKLGASSNRRSGGFDFYGRDADGAPAGRHHVDSGPGETGVTFTGTYRHPLGERHALALGWDAGRARRNEDRSETIYDAAGAQTDASNADYSANVRRLALFAQDEWQVTKDVSVYAGLRHERLQTASRALAANAPDALDVSSAVWSPSLQARYALPNKDVLRLALARTYKAPELAKLVPRRYTTDNNNNPNNPDEQGNPDLRPELAWGLDAAYERYLGDGAVASMSAYWRRIRDVTQMRLFEEDGIWVQAPFNNGTASVRGIELEARLPLRRLLPGMQALALDLRANLSRNWSTVANVPGPDNRLEAQVPVTANLGADYRLPATAWTVGGDFNYQGGGAVRQSAQLRSGTQAKRELDLYALWAMDARTQLRLSASNLLHRQAREWQDYAQADGNRHRVTLTPTSAGLRIMLERQL